MYKNWYFLFLSLFIATTFSFGCKHPNQPEPPTPDPQDTVPTDTVPLQAVKGAVPTIGNWIYDGRPEFTYHLLNPNAKDVSVDLKVHIVTDQRGEVGYLEKRITVPAGADQNFSISTDTALAPGFYRGSCYLNGSFLRSYTFGVSPFDIVSAPDKQPDYDAFWQEAKAQLAAVDMQAELTEIPSKSNANCKVYLVSFYSAPDGLTGDPVLIHGYYLEPQDGKPHPVIMHFYGYDSQKPGALACPSGSGAYAEFHLSHRGQYINNRTAAQREPDGKGDFVNIYGDWFAYHFGDKNSYYYRGAFLDCVQAVRFMSTRPTSDMSNLFAEGSSQGGALCYAAAALSDIPFSAIAPNVAFLGDFPDYFRIVTWPGNTAKENQGSMTDEQMYAFLSYFDTKNLATRISCAVWATSGLQDGTCPPHTNVAPFNNLLSTDKQMNFYPEMTHAYPSTWSSDIMSFFRSHTK